MRSSFSLWILAVSVFTASSELLPRSFAQERIASSPIERALGLDPGPGNPRNSEGDFVQLKDGRVLFVYTYFVGGADDHAKAYLAGRYSGDGGKTWTAKDVTILPAEGDWNVMSVSLLRLQDGQIALFYLRKNSLEDCRPYMRISSDEAKTWSEPILCITDEVGYYVLNNDRAIQLKSGRLLLPVALHNKPGDAKPDWKGTLFCYLSDDNGMTWRRSKSSLQGKSPDGKRWSVQEPGVVELKDGRVMMFVRSDVGSQLLSISEDAGETWAPLQSSNIASPVSPASIERIPSSGDLLLVWNDHQNIDPKLKGKRTPLAAAVSRDEGKTWSAPKLIESNPNGWYCYTAIEFVGDHVLLGHCAGDRTKDNGLARSQVTRIPISWLYK